MKQRQLEACTAVLEALNKASIPGGYAGKFAIALEVLSHFRAILEAEAKSEQEECAE